MKGSCLCGLIECEADSIDMPISHCHCRTCRKAHAAPFATTAGVMRAMTALPKLVINLPERAKWL